MAEDEVLMEVIVNECDEVQFYSPADQCKTLYEDKDAMLRTIIEAVKEGLLILPTVKWNEIKSVRFLSNIEKSVEIMTQEVHQETEYETYEIVEESPVDEAVASSDVREEIIIDVGLSSGNQLNSKTENETLESINFIDERLNLCPYCDYRTYNVGHFKVHMRQHTGEAPFACEFCSYRSKQKSNLKRHMRQHLEGKDNFECEMCSFTCTKEKVYKRHLKLHQRSRPLRPCPFCDYFSSSLAHLTVHIRQHTGETPYHCGVCQYKTVQKSNLTRHLKKHRHHRVSKADKLRVCDHCNYRTPNSAHLLAHIRAAHTGEAPYSCQHCDYKSAQRSNLKRHLRKHTGERPFACHLCNYTTAYPYVLKKHVENHPDQDQKYLCTSCDYFTNSFVEFKRHLKTHSGRSMLCCHFCGYITLNSDHFKVHLRRHTKEAPYQCHHCDYSSAQRSNLKRHILTHTEDIKRSKDESNSEEQDIIESEIIDEDPRSEMVDNSDGNHIPQNVQIIDTTRMGDNEDVEMYEAEEGYVETTYVHDEEIEEETVPTESSIEVVEEHVITSQAETEYRNYEGLGKIYLCSNCPYQSTNTDDIEAHIQEHEASLANGVDSAENGISESDVSKTNISFLNKSQTEKLKEFKRLLQEGTVGSGNNMVQFTKTHPKKVNVAGEMKNGFHQPIETGLRNKTNTGGYVHNENVSYAQENENVEFRNEPSPEEVTLYGEYNEAEHQEEIIEEDIPLRESSVIIVGTAEELKEKNECELCGFNARTIWELKSHIRVHTGEMSYVCPQCPFKTNQKNSFQRHVRHLHGWRGSSLPYQCKACDFKTKNKDVFFKHTQIHSAKKIPSIECNICEQVMGNLSELKGHMKLHIGEAPYECFHCGKLTARKLQMRRHMKKHICALEGKGPPYECDSCGYQTVFKSNYMRHLETHELDPPKALICHYCRYVTLDNKVFKEHLREHNVPDRLQVLKDQSKQCPYCDYKTYNAGHFKVHLRQHAGVAPFSCKLCPYSSAQNSNLKRHIKLKHHRSVEAGDILISEETGSDNTHSLSTNEAAETSNHKRKPLREQNSSLESETTTITSPNIKKSSVKDGTQEIIPVSDKKHKKSMRTSMAKKREYIKRLGNITESELRIRRRLDFNIRKAPKESRNGFNVEVRGEILKSKRQLRDFNDYGKVVKTSDLEMSTVLEKESQLDSIFATLRESIQFLKERKNSSDNVATFTIYFKTKEEQDPLEFAESLTDLEAELLSDSNDNDSDNDSLKLDEDLSSSVLLDLDEETEEETSSKNETNRSENGISLGKGNKKKPLVNPGVSNMKLLQNIMLRNEKMKQMRRLKVLRNSTWNASSVRSEPKTSKSRVTVGYPSSDNVEMEEVVVDHNIDSLPSLV